MSDQYSLYVPKKLDAKAKFLLWDFDLVASGCLGFAIGIVVNSFLVGVIAAALCIAFYAKVKSGRHPGFGIHWFYWHTPGKMFKRTPSSSRSFFCG